MQADQLIRELIATGAMNDDTLADLERMRVEFEAGELHPDDAAYIEALHAKITGAPLPEPVDEPQVVGLDGLTISEWRDRALKAEAELEALRAASGPEASPPA